MGNGLRFNNVGAKDNLTVSEVIKTLDLIPLPGEGGMYRCIYTGKEGADGRAAYSSIYYLLTENSFSHMHRLKTDEIYHYYMGEGLELLLLYPDGTKELRSLGPDLIKGERPQLLVPAGVWQGSRIASGFGGHMGYCLAGTTMSPGYRDEDYEHGNLEYLCRSYPQAEKEIKRRCGEAAAR